MKRWVPMVVAVVLVAAAFLVWKYKGRSAGDQPAPAQPATKAAAKAAPGRGGAADMIAPFSREPDAEGSLRLEGLVVDEAGAPVAGAKIWVSSEPKRETAAEDDGSFAFDKLLGRRYVLTAQAGALVGSASHTLSDKSPPVTIIVKQGATLTVTVTSDEGPVAGARVAVEALAEYAQATKADGKATLVGVSEGWTTLTVRADGFAAHAELIELAGKTKEVAVRLARGAAVHGRVVDEAGKPIEGAKIFAIDASSFYDEIDRQPLAQSDSKGDFTLAAVAPGSYRVRARHPDFATATSSITTVDTNGVRDALVLTMKAGIALRGRVVTVDKQPVPYAGVGLSGTGVEGTRSTTALADGTFEFRGVVVENGRKTLERIYVQATSENAASNFVSIFSAAPTADGTQDISGIELVLELTGTISGITIDEAGVVVPEASVVASLDPTKSAPELSNFAYQPITTTSDADGTFELRGLAENAEYFVTASRSGVSQETNWLTVGLATATAKTGAVGVKVVVPGEGKVIGKVAFADGSVPPRGIARLDWQQRATVTEGAFEFSAVAAGSYALRVRGAGFVEGAKYNVAVKGGQTTDVGTIVVERGRTVAGVVRDVKGRPVAGATVYLGNVIIASGKGPADAGDAALGEARGLQSTASASDGTFSFGGVGAGASTVVAEHRGGRSLPVAVLAGTDDVRDAVVVMRALGGLRGTVTAGGKPTAAQVLASPEGVPGAITVVNAGDDGGFAIEQLPEGTYNVRAQTTDGDGVHTGTAAIAISAGKQALLAIDIPIGDIELTVEVVGKDGAKIDAAQIFVFAGTVAAKNGAELVDVYAKVTGASMQFYWFGTAFPKFPQLRAGAHSICTMPIAGNMMDQEASAKVNAHAGELAIYCQVHDIAATPKQQTFTHTVPPMKPLP